MDYIDSFKQYVPAEILASFTAINAVLEIPEPTPLINDMVIIPVVIAILTALFVIEALASKRIDSRILIAVTALTLPFWCVLIAIDRFETGLGEPLPRSLITIVLILASLAMTLLGKKPKPETAGNAV